MKLRQEVSIKVNFFLKLHSFAAFRSFLRRFSSQALDESIQSKQVNQTCKDKKRMLDESFNGESNFLSHKNPFFGHKRSIARRLLKFKDTKMLIQPLFSSSSDIDEYIDSGFLALQRAIDKAYIELSGEQNPNEFKVCFKKPFKWFA